MKRFFGHSINPATALLLAACSATTNIPATAPAISGSGVFYADDGSSISATYYSDETVILQFQDATQQTLRAARSGSGTRYTLNSREWWEHQGKATYTVNGKTIFVGKLKQ